MHRGILISIFKQASSLPLYIIDEDNLLEDRIHFTSLTVVNIDIWGDYKTQDNRLVCTVSFK